MVVKGEKYYVNGDYVGAVAEDSKRFINFYPNGVMGTVSRLYKEGETNYSLKLCKSIKGKWKVLGVIGSISEESKLGKELMDLEKEGVFKKNAN